jgi:hypothetical protein
VPVPSPLPAGFRPSARRRAPAHVIPADPQWEAPGAVDARHGPTEATGRPPKLRLCPGNCALLQHRGAPVGARRGRGSGLEGDRDVHAIWRISRLLQQLGREVENAHSQYTG